MELLERRIREDGTVLPGGVLKVDGFLNHQMDIALFEKMADEFYRLYSACGINKILTIEASGIGLACITGRVFGCPVLFAKKSKTRNLDGDFYTARVESFTHGTENTILVSKKFLASGDKVLIIDDFLANGAALFGLISLVEQAGATVAGAGIAIEKAFQPGGARVRTAGYRVESLARIKAMDDDGGIEFCR
ncbi:MAG: xanthine phosphoribosyltransferase [Oscillospiraceae bacterium]